MKRPAFVPAMALALSSVAASQTTTLDFSGLSNADLHGGYGDYVDGPSTDGFSYTGTGGFTPHVSVAFGGQSPTAGTAALLWSTGYNDLVDVIYAPILGGSTDPAEVLVTLSADPGHQATLESFDIGNWGVSVTLPYVRVEDENGTVLFEELDVVLNPNSSADEKNYVLSPAPTGQVLTLRISVRDLGNIADNVGIDNLTFGEVADPDAPLFDTYCVEGTTNGANPNASGHAGVMRALGSASIADNDLTLLGTGLPMTSFGFFITSQTRGFVAGPGGSAGNLCVLGSIGRYVGPGQILNTGGSGTMELALDLTQMPTPTGLVSAMPGEQWNFQAWHRDTIGGVATSNFTEAVSIDFVL